MRVVLLEKVQEQDNDLISQEKKQYENERYILEKTKDNSILPKEN